MKVYDVVNEAPVSAVDRAKQAIGGKFSAGQKRKGEVSKEANKVAKELKSRLSGAGVDLKKIPADTFLDVLKQTGYGQGAEQQINRFTSGSENTLNKKQAEQIILKQVQSASLSPQGSGIKKGKFAGGNQSSQNKTAKKSSGGFKAGFERGKQKKKSSGGAFKAGFERGQGKANSVPASTSRLKSNASKKEKIQFYIGKIKELPAQQQTKLVNRIREIEKNQ
jgi:hypothetical protein